MALTEERDFWVGQIIYQLQGVVISTNERATTFHLNKALADFERLVELVAAEYGYAVEGDNGTLS